MTNEKVLDISWKTILKIALALVCFYIFYSIRDIFVWFIFAVIISVLFNPGIDFLQKKKIPRIIATIFVYFFIFGAFSLLIWLVIPLFIGEIGLFLRNFPEYFQKISPLFQGLGLAAFKNLETFMSSLSGAMEAMAGNIFNVVFAIFGGFFSSTFVITAAIFISLEEKSIEKILVLVFPKKYEGFALNVWQKSQKKVAGWFAARFLACLFVGAASAIVFLIFNIKYAYALGLLAGVLNFIPYIGPLLTALLLFLIIFPASILKAIFILIAFFLVQQIENQVLSPLLMKKMVNLPPVLVLISLVIGGKIWGFLGSLLVVPLAGILFEFTKEFLQRRKMKEQDAEQQKITA